MKLMKVKMKNFRGFSDEKEIDFEGNPFILLSAPNGTGKTSVIDAVEWCLTGSIGRLKEAYDNRSTNNTERKKNWDGILKNKNAGKNEYTEVELVYMDQAEVFRLSRRQKSDDLNSESSEVMLNGSYELAKTELEKFIDKSFYNYHFCDVQKSFGIQSKQRKDLPELFTEFITDYGRESAIAVNLETFATDVDRYITDLWAKKVDDSEIEHLKTELNRYTEMPEIVSYPQEALYEGEKTDITQMDEAGLNEQLQQLYLCGYFAANTCLSRLMDDRHHCDVISRLKDLKQSLEEKRQEIDLVFKYNLHSDQSELEAVSGKIERYEKIHLDAKNIRENAELLLSFKSEHFTRDFYENAIKEINEKEKSIRELERDIQHLTEGNGILSAFTELIAQKEGILQYHMESERCPVCGSAQFGKLEDSQILNEAEKYLSDNSCLVKEKTEMKVRIGQPVQAAYKTLIEKADAALKAEIKLQRARKQQFADLTEQTRHYFTLANQLVTTRDVECRLEDLKSAEYIQSSIDLLSRQLLQEKERDKIRNDYQDVLSLLGYQFADEEESTTASRIREQAQNSPKTTEFNYPLLVRKINAVQSVKNNRTYMENVRLLKQYNKTNDAIFQQEKQLLILRDKARQRSGKIQQLIERLKKEEYDSVGPELKRYYKKLARLDSLTAINIVSEGGQISIIDENGKNLVNILSNGQLGVFMLSYFFAGITKRSKREHFKVYFIDDLTSCMDDVNMLSFLDLLKYQMLEQKNMEQVFFLTCDDRISRLLKYKLEGCGVNYCEIGKDKLSAG